MFAFKLKYFKLEYILKSVFNNLMYSVLNIYNKVCTVYNRNKCEVTLIE